MKKFLSIALAVLFAGNAMALDNVPKSGMTWIGFGGMTVSNLKGENMNPKVGVTFGAKMEYMLPNAYGTYISAGLDWTHKGARVTQAENRMTTTGLPVISNVTRKIQAHYLEIPIHVGYRYNYSKKFGIYGEFGPYFAFGVTGKYQDKPENDMVVDQSKAFFGKHAGLLLPSYQPSHIDKVRAIQRFDCGFGFRVGAEYNNTYSLTIGYDWGFTDMYTDDFRTIWANAHPITMGGTIVGYEQLEKKKNHNLMVTFGYRF